MDKEKLVEEIKGAKRLLQRTKPFIEQAYQQASDSNLGYSMFLRESNDRYMEIMKECKEILEGIEGVLDGPE